jgi:two-component system, chemotaxis family, CheB/CheR fusion protein
MPRAEKKLRTKKPASKPALQTETAIASKAKAPFPIVAIGASAGGFEAFINLLRSLPKNPGLALVFIPHLDPTHESAMVDLLARATEMSVEQANDGTTVTDNRLFVLPPNFDMTISGGVLRLAKREAARGQHMPIDTFFRSLADDQLGNAVGVILSGTANDGTVGLSAIKNQGGITFAQSPDSAKYDGMPTSAIASGAVDFILPVDQIARELIRIQKRPSGAKTTKDPFEGKENLLRDIFRLLKGYSKVDFVEYKSATIRRRITRRMNINQVGELGDYVKLLHRNAQEIEALYRDVLINVTSFFRNPEVFESLREHVYPKLFQDRPITDAVRVWVPGCSTGEETYSHAIALVEILSELRLEVPIQIFGTDLSENAIQRARAGVYKESISSEVSEIRLRRFFHKVTGGYQISKSIRDMCIFARQNVFSDPPFSRMDLISCRNVLIYLSPVLQKKVIPIFHYALKPAGFLLVGNTEGLVGSGSEIFDLVDRKTKIYRKKAVASPVTFGLAVGSHEPPELREKPMHVPREDDKAKTPADVQREADRLLLTKYVPSAVVVNEDMEILQSRGSTNRYLELPAGKVSLNLFKMARQGLLYELRALVEQARQKSTPVSKEGVSIDDGKSPATARLEVIPFRTPARDRRHFLVLFEETSTEDGVGAATAEQSPKPPSKDMEDAKGLQISQLKQELAATKEYLQSIIEGQEATNEELQSANEEIQSGNEELQSTNEELQTSKEELESANEELNTVNEEIQHRNQQLSQLSNDLINLLNSCTIPMLLLGEDLRIRRYTPEAEKVLGFSGNDVGKPLTNVRLSVDVPQIERWMLDVMRDVTSRSERIQLRGAWYKLRITPYRTLENKIDGVVLAMVDVSDMMGHSAAKHKSRRARKE